MNALPSFFGEPWVERLGQTLIHFLWQGLLIAVFYGAARAIWFRRKSPNARYGLACAALAAMLAAPVVTFLAIHPAGPVIPGTPYFARPGSTDSASAFIKAPDLTPSLPPASAPAGRTRQSLKWLVLFWAIGVIGFSLRLISGWLAVTRMRLSQTQPAPGDWQDRLSRLGRRVGVSQPVQLLVSALVKSPSVAGWLRPVILVPVGALTGLPVEYIESLLLHELAHIRRYDYLVNFLQNAGEALLFYHPAVWWVSRHMRAERELCCDDVAASACGDVLTYVKALTEWERTRISSAGAVGLRATVAVDGGSLPERIARLLGSSSAYDTRSSPAGLMVAALLLTVTAVGLFAQSPAKRPPFNAFEVATIKPGGPETNGSWYFNMKGTHEFVIGGTLKQIMIWGYNTTPDLISGGPAWTDSDHYDVVAEAPNDVRPTQQENMVMLQKLLADRFHLVIHRAPKVLPVFELVLAKNGPTPALQATATPDNDPFYSGNQFMLKYSAFPMARLAAMLQRGIGPVDRPVIDKTGLPGKYDFQLEFDGRRPRPADSDKPDLFTALQEQLGLKLEPKRESVDGIVIDSADRPSEN